MKRAEDVAGVVCRDDLRRYHRFRSARFYGGITTADCVGCCLRCVFCWSWPKVVRPERYGPYYSPQEVAKKLTSIARKKGFHQVICITHLPQIARFGRCHFKIAKGATQGRTRTTITPLEAEARLMELARMLAGLEITNKALAYAREMMVDQGLRENLRREGLS